MFRTKPDISRIDLTLPRDLFLSKDEEERAARFRFEKDCVAWSRARSACRSALAQALNVAPLDLEFCYGEHGKPSLVGCSLQFNLTHSGDWAMIAISREAPVGIDIERIRPNVQIGKLLRRIGEPVPEASLEELFRMWARREARTKAEGGPLMRMPDETTMAIDVEAPPGYVAAVAYCVGIR